MTQNNKLLTSIWFLTGLTILLLNDIVLKSVYGNWITGKLSDFAGLFIFPLFWTALLPRHKNKIFILTALLFIFWKSPYSTMFINLWNSIGILNISRIVDYTDLIALSILPLAYYLETIKERLTSIRLSPYIPLLICVYAFMATSRPRSNTYFDDNTAVYHIKHHSRETFIDELKNIGLDITSTKYNHTKYDDEHTEIHNLNDSIKNLVISIGDFNNSTKTVEVSLLNWDYTKDSSRLLDEETLEKERASIKWLFEQKVINRINE